MVIPEDRGQVADPGGRWCWQLSWDRRAGQWPSEPAGSGVPSQAALRVSWVTVPDSDLGVSLALPTCELPDI